MTDRTRYYQYPLVDSGNYSGWTRGPVQPGFDYCEDVVGNRKGDNRLRLAHLAYNFIRFNGTGGDGGIAIDFIPDNYLPGMNNEAWFFPNSSSEMIKAMSYTNPNRPVVDVPLFIFELRDLPHMVKSLGDNLIQSAHRFNRRASIRDTMHMGARGNLTVQFGWLPLISDIKKMLNFQAAANRRFLELKRLQNEKTGLRRKVKLTRDVREDTYYNVPLQTNGFQAVCDYNYVMTTESWATLRWRLAEGWKFPPFDSSLHKLAWTSIAGLSFGLELETAWNAIPFSWLADYFGNIGDILGASRNSIPVTATEGVWMCTQKMSAQALNVRINPPGMSWKDGNATGTWKYRDVFPTIPLNVSVEFPFLDAQQWSILGSLFTPSIFKELDKLGLGGLR